MGKGDNRITKEFDPKELAELTSKATADEDHATPVLTVGRTTTLDDPMTTALLASVASRSQTADFDRDTINVLLDSIDDADHPHIRRRKA